MSNRYFSKNKKSSKKVFKLIKRKRANILELLDLSIVNKDDKTFQSLLESVDSKRLKDGIVSTKNKLSL